MKILALASLNANLMRAKFSPLTAADWVESIVCVTYRAGPPMPRLEYVVVPDSASVLRRSVSVLLASSRVLADRPIDLILAYNILPFGLFARLLSIRTGKPYSINVLGSSYEIDQRSNVLDNGMISGLPLAAPLWRKVAWMVLSGARFITTTGHVTRSYLIARGIAPRRVVVQSSVVDPEHFRPGTGSPDVDIVCLCRVVPLKRLEILIDLAGALRGRHPGIQVHVVGPGPLRGALAEEARRRGLAAAVHLPGGLDDVRPALWRSRVFLLPSPFEGLPLSMIEAMACGLPPIIGRIGDVPDLVVNGENGRIVDVDDPASYIRAADELLTDPGERSRLAANAVASVRRTHSLRCAIEHWNQMYDEVVLPALAQRP